MATMATAEQQVFWEVQPGVIGDDADGRLVRQIPNVAIAAVCVYCSRAKVYYLTRWSSRCPKRGRRQWMGAAQPIADSRTNARNSWPTWRGVQPAGDLWSKALGAMA